MAGAELGTMLGWMSTRVLGQYDLLLIEDEDPDDQDVVYYVGPNILALATHGRAGLDALWSGSIGSRVIARGSGPFLLVHPEPAGARPLDSE